MEREAQTMHHGRGGFDMVAGSLFSGIGGLDAGLARAGVRHSFLCESDPWRRGVLAERFPGVPVYDDVRSIRRDERRGISPSPDDGCEYGDGDWASGVDLLCGGFPCQDLSVAGRRAGLEAGERSSLFFEYARIAESLRPRWLLVENVPGLLSSQGGRDFGLLLGTLADLGYGLAWRVLDSRFFGVPQRRRRVFIVGALAESDPRAAAERAGQVLAVGSRCHGHPATRGEAGPGASDTPGYRFADGGVPGIDSISTLTAKKYGGWRVGSDEAAGGQLVAAAPLSHGAVRRLTPRECERLQALPDDWTLVPDTAPDSRRYAALGDAVTASVGEWIGRRLMAAAHLGARVAA